MIAITNDSQPAIAWQAAASPYDYRAGDPEGP